MRGSLVSILIPAYNAERYVGQTIESALGQTYPNVEVVVVDDGSTDGTRDVIRRYEDRVQVIDQPNAGAAAARNTALQASRGDLALFLDGDDVIDPDHIRALADRLGDSSRHVAMSMWDRFYTDPAEARFPHRPAYRDASGVDWVVSDWIGAQPMTQSGMFLIPRDLIDHVGGWDERLSLIDDFEFFARLLVASDGVRFEPGARLYYRSGLEGSLSGRQSREAVESALLSLSVGTDHLLAAEDSERTRRAAAAIFQNFVHTYYPDHPDLTARARRRAAELGGSSLSPDGPPGFQKLRPIVGWRLARRIQRVAERVGLNRAARSRT